MTPAEILRAAKAKIEKPENWCQHNYAQTKQGRPIGANEANACRWCAIGALRAVGGSGGRAIDFLAMAAHEAGAPTIWILNDTADHAAVLAAYIRAIALAEGEEK